MKTYIANRIRERRKALGLRQDDLAELTHLTQAQISRYERGENEPTAEAIIQLAQALRTSTDYLLGLSDVVSPLTSEDQEDALDLLNRFPPEMRNEIVQRLAFELALFKKGQG